MNIQLKKTVLIKMLEETQNLSILNAIENLFQKEKKDWWHDLPQSVKDDIEESEKQIERGECSDFKEFISKYI